MTTPAGLEAWYARQHPGADVPDGACLKVLTALAPMYRLPIVDTRLCDDQTWDPDETASGRREPITDPCDYKYEPLPGGGITTVPGRGARRGLRVVLRPGYAMSTFDMDELTRLVIAAHRWLCRVEVSTAMREDDAGDTVPCGVELTITPRIPETADAHLFDYHPPLARLVERAASASEDL